MTDCDFRIPFADFSAGTGPIAACALHNGHHIPKEILPLMCIGEEDRLREEDPFTGNWTRCAPTRIVVNRSRFSVDVNRSRNRAVYLCPKDAWGLNIWKKPPSDDVIEAALSEYDAFYLTLQKLLDGILRTHPRFILLDLHSYNYRRNGPAGPPADRNHNPDVNFGTRAMDRTCWENVVDRAMSELRRLSFNGRHLDVRENVRFPGGHICRWVQARYGSRGCVLAIEFRKFFMDEWTGAVIPEKYRLILPALKKMAESIEDALNCGSFPNEPAG